MDSGAAKHTELNIFIRCAIVLFVVASIVLSIHNLMRYNDYRDKIEELEYKKNEYVESIERIEYELGCEFDDEYVIRIAKEKLNLCMPNESVYYNGLD
ncbi:MAG: septum formation initiator family protein [Clostridia bacterium]|nr:septum formation initiator family protein [Clostridia bacterium]